MYNDLNRRINFSVNTYLFFYILPFLLIFNGYWEITGALISLTFLIFVVNKYHFDALNIQLSNSFVWTLLLGWGLYILFKSPEFGTGLKYYLATIFIPFLVFILFANMKLSTKFLNRFFFILFIVGAILGAYSFYEFVSSGFNLTARLSSLWDDVNMVSALLMILSFFNISTILNRAKNENLLPYLITLAFMYIGILLSQTRGVLLAIILSFLIFIVKRPKIILPALIISLLVGLLFSSVIIDRFLSVKNFQSDASSLGRLQAWFATIILLKSNLFTGYGFDSFIHLRDSIFSFYIVQVLHSHSTYLRALLEMGLIGAVLYFSFFFKAILYSFTFKKNSKIYTEYKTYIEGLQLSFIGLCIVFFFEPYFSLYGGSTLVIWILISITFNLHRRYKAENSSLRAE